MPALRPPTRRLRPCCQPAARRGSAEPPRQAGCHGLQQTPAGPFSDVAVMMVVPSAGTLARRHYTSFSSHSETFECRLLDPKRTLAAPAGIEPEVEPTTKFWR